MITSAQLKQITAEARPIIERMLNDATALAGLRDVVAAAGGDWSQLKALLKAQIQDEEAGEDKRVRKVLEKAEYATAYADMLGIGGNLNEQYYSDNSSRSVEAATSPGNDGVPTSSAGKEGEADRHPIEVAA